MAHTGLSVDGIGPCIRSLPNLSLSYLEQLSQALQRAQTIAPPPPDAAPAAAAAAAAALEWATPAEFFPPPPPLPPPPELPAVSAANPFRFIARPAAPTLDAAAAATSSAAQAAVSVTGNSFAEDYHRVQLAQRAADNAKQVAALQASRAAAAARDAEKNAVARAANKIIAQARRGSSSARAIDIDDAAAGGGSAIGTHEADDDPNPSPEDDPNDAPLPSNFGQIRPRDLSKSSGRLPASKSDWSLRQRLMPRAAPSSARTAAHAPPAVTVAQRDARVGKALMPSQSRWVSKNMQADEARAAARKEAQRAALAQSVRTAPGVAQVARMPPAAASLAASPRLPHTAGFGSIAKAPHLRPAAVAAAAATPLAMSAAIKRKRDEEGTVDLVAAKKPSLASRALAPSTSAAAAAVTAAAASSATPSRRIPKKSSSGIANSAASVAGAAAAASAATPPAAAAAAAAAYIPVIPLPRTVSSPIPTSLRQGFVDALLALCLRYHPEQFDATALHPSLPSNALLLRCEWELLEKTLRHKDAAGQPALQLATYRESSQLVLQLMSSEKDIVGVSKLIATL